MLMSGGGFTQNIRRVMETKTQFLFAVVLILIGNNPNILGLFGGVIGWEGL